VGALGFRFINAIIDAACFSFGTVQGTRISSEGTKGGEHGHLAGFSDTTNFFFLHVGFLSSLCLLPFVRICPSFLRGPLFSQGVNKSVLFALLQSE
jgi:hypothetical protein